MEQHVIDTNTGVLSCHRFLINPGVEKVNINMDLNYDHQMSLSKSKCWYSNNCLHFLKCAVPLRTKKIYNICSQV